MGCFLSDRTIEEKEIGREKSEEEKEGGGERNDTRNE
jgi:hypothetical protein